MSERPPIVVPTEEDLRKVRGEMSQYAKWRFTHWCNPGGENLLEVGNRILCQVPMKCELEVAARHAATACNGLPWLLDEIDRLRAALQQIRDQEPDVRPWTNPRELARAALQRQSKERDDG